VGEVQKKYSWEVGGFLEKCGSWEIVELTGVGGVVEPDPSGSEIICLSGAGSEIIAKILDTYML
jgi:hypothetical protein